MTLTKDPPGGIVLAQRALGKRFVPRERAETAQPEGEDSIFAERISADRGERAPITCHSGKLLAGTSRLINSYDVKNGIKVIKAILGSSPNICMGVVLVLRPDAACRTILAGVHDPIALEGL